MPRCEHCMIEFRPEEGVEYLGKEFCCKGCRGVYSLIHEEGLEGFYAKRRPSEWKSGLVEGVEIDPERFKGSLKPLPGTMMEADIVVEGIRCATCLWLIEKVLLRIPGVKHASVNYATHRACIRFEPSEVALADVLTPLAAHGYTPRPYERSAEEEAARLESRDLLLRFGTAGFLSMQLMVYSAALYAGYFQGMEPRLKFIFELICLGLATPVLFYSARPMLEGAVRSLRVRAFNMDVLVSLGAMAAYAYSIYGMLTGGQVYFDTSAMIITFILLGRYIEHGARRRAMDAVGRLLRLAPAEAVRVDASGGRTQVSVQEMRIGDMMEVKPGARLSLDGVVAEGQGEVDEALLTGEARPVYKAMGAEVFGGTVNLYGRLLVRVTRTGQDTAVARIARAVAEAQARRAPVQAVADRVVGVFVPAVLVIAMASLCYRLYINAPVEDAVMSAVAVLVIACPCALGLATPLAIVIGTTAAASKGVLIKGGDVIEAASRIDTVVLDKTGTLTEGRPELAYYSGLGGMEDIEALLLAGSLEQASEHSVGRAIVQAARGKGLKEVAGFAARPGQGVRGVIGGAEVLAGNWAFMQTSKVDVAGLTVEVSEKASSLEATGHTVVWLARAGALAGVFAVRDRVRAGAGDAVGELGRRGIEVRMFTGDNEAAARALAKEAGLGRVEAGMSPQGKAEGIRTLKAEGRHVAMVGDGINDAPSLVEADLGIAMGGATDIALESADMVLMRGELGLLPYALRASRRTFSVIRQNIFWAFFYNVVAVPLAVAGVLHPIVAAGAMALSSATVVVNSLRAKVR